MKALLKVGFSMILSLLMPTSIIFAKDLIPSGETIGIEMKMENIMIADTYDVKDNLKIYNPSKDSDIKIGDYILKINNVDLDSSSSLINYLKTMDEGVKEVKLTLKRGNKIINRQLKVIKSSNNSWKTGLVIKDKILSIGTMTFYDPETNSYAALGHEIANNTTGEIVDISSGYIYSSTVTGINKSYNGQPGEKVAEINKNEQLGDIKTNNSYGIYGKTTKIPTDLPILEVADMDEIKLGRAEIWTVIKGNKIEKFEIEIIQLEKQNKQSTKGITFKITDKRLLSISNGIVQGMSGSPIIQDGKIIGAVTHMMINNVTTGHGLYINWMLNEVEKMR